MTRTRQSTPPNRDSARKRKTNDTETSPKKRNLTGQVEQQNERAIGLDTCAPVTASPDSSNVPTDSGAGRRKTNQSPKCTSKATNESEDQLPPQCPPCEEDTPQTEQPTDPVPQPSTSLTVGPTTTSQTSQSSRGCHSLEFICSDNPNLLLDSDPDFHLPWSRALSNYRAKLEDSAVEIVWNSLARHNSAKKIVNVIFHNKSCEDKDSKSKPYSFNSARGAERILIPAQEERLLNHGKKEEFICVSQTVLVKERFERVMDWVEWEKPDDTAPCPRETAEGLTVPEFWKLGKEVLHDEEKTPESKIQIMKVLVQAGETAYEARTAMLIQDAFLEGMKDSAGRDGVRALLEHICNVVDGDRLRVKCHGTANYDGYGINLYLIPYKILDMENGMKTNITVGGEGGGVGAGGGGGDVTDEDLDISSEIDETGSFRRPRQRSATPTSRGQRRSGSATPKGTIRRSLIERKSCTDNADLTVFVRNNVQALPLLVVEIKSAPTDEVFQMQKHLLGGLQFKDEIFGLTINPLFGRIYRMRKDSSLKVFYTSQTYEFDHHTANQIEWDSNEFSNMCEDLHEIFQYGIQSSS